MEDFKITSFEDLKLICFLSPITNAKQTRQTNITVKKPARFPHPHTEELHHQSWFQLEQFFSEIQNHSVT